MNDEPTPTDEDVAPRKMSLLGPKTAAERAQRTLRKNWTMPGLAPTLPAAPVEPAEPEEPAAPDVQVEEAADTPVALPSFGKKKKDKKKKSKKKKNKDKKSQGIKSKGKKLKVKKGT